MYANTMNYLEHAKRGSESVGQLQEAQRAAPMPEVVSFIGQLLTMKKVKINTDTSGGVKESVEVIPIPLRGQGFTIAKVLEELRPTVFVSSKLGLRQGMMSPNYDAHGRSKLSSVRVLPLARSNFTVTKAKGLWVPDASAAASLAGATSLEAKGVGSHSVNSSLGADVEHKLTAMGALSIGREDISINHAQHLLRESGGSVAEGLTSGKLGDLFSSSSLEGVEGFGAPLM